MLNIIKKSIGYLVGQANKVIAALTQYGATLNLPHSVAADLPTRLAALNTANAAHKDTLVVMKNKRLALLAAAIAARRFIRLVRENLKPALGNRYSEQWSALGFSGNLRLPKAVEALLNPLLLIKGYLTNYPIADGGPGLAAERADQLHSDLSDAIAAVAQQQEVVDTAKSLRDEKAQAVEEALRIVLGELHQVLDPMDALWLAFGFKKPGAKHIPDVPQNLVATLVGATAVSVKWDPAARAEHYRIWMKVVGVDEEFAQVGTSSDLDFTIEGLPGNATIEVVVAAVNNGGESQHSVVLTVQTV